MTEPPPSLRDHRPDLPSGLDAVLARMMAVRPEDRYATPQAVMEALRPYLKPDLPEHSSLPAVARSARSIAWRLRRAARPLTGS